MGYIYSKKHKLIGNQLDSSYRHIGINSDGAAPFLICISLKSQQLYLRCVFLNAGRFAKYGAEYADSAVDAFRIKTMGMLNKT